MFSPMFQEVKLVGMGQPWSGVAPSGPAFMYQAQTTPPAALAPTPDPSWDLEQNPPPQPPVPAPSQAPVLPPSPAAKKINTQYVMGGIALLAFAAALLIPSNR